MAGSARPETQGEGPSSSPSRPEEVLGGNVGAIPEVERLRAENEQLREQVRSLRDRGPSPAPARRHWIRSIATPVLVVLASLSIVAATVGVWFDRTVWNTDRYIALVAPLADDPAVTDVVAAFLTTEVFEALDMQRRVEDALGSIPNLPPSAEFLAGPITAGARDVVARQVQTFLASEAFRNLWIELNRTVHIKIVALLERDYSQLPNVSVEGGEVRLNLVSAVAEVLRRIVQQGINGLGLDVTIPTLPADVDASVAIERLSGALGVSLPDDFGQVTVMTEDQLEGYQETAAELKRIDGILVLLTVILIAAAMVVSPSRRRTAIWLGIAAVAGLFLGGGYLRRIESRIVDTIMAPGAKAAAQDVFVQVSASLRRAGIFVGVVALAIALGAYLTGRPPWLLRLLGRIRRATTQAPGGSALEIWVARHADAARIASVAVAVVALFLTAVDWLPVAIIGAILALALWQIAKAEHRVVEVP